MALYSKYRPHTFADMVGQEASRKTLLSVAKHGNFSHAYLFCGTRGTGKTTSARILAKAINCENRRETGDPCEQCSLCLMADEGRLTDIIEIDAASNRGIDEVRSLIEKVAFQPNFGKAKIYIIDEVHMMTKEAFNALLKTIEEPPAHAYFILATTEFHKVPETIRSRCQTYFFRNIPVETIVSRLRFICDQEGFFYSQKGLEMIASRASGGLRDAISLLEQSASYGEITEENLLQSLGLISPQTIQEFMNTIRAHSLDTALSIITSIQAEGRNLEEFGKDFLWFLREELHKAITQKSKDIPTLLAYIEIFQAALQKSKQLPFPSLAFEMAIAECFLLEKGEIIPVPKKEEKKLPEASPAKKEAEFLKSAPSAAKPMEMKKDEKTEEITSPPWEDDLFPPASSPKEYTSISSVEILPESFEETKNGKLSKAEWESICQKMPTSVKIYLLRYCEIVSFENHHLSLLISSPSIKSFLEGEKTKPKIENILSKHFGNPVTVDFYGAILSEEALTPEGLEALFRL